MKEKLPAAAEPAKRPKWQILLLLVVNFVIAFAIYQLFLRAESMIGTILYLAAAFGLTIAYFLINRGFGQPITDASLLPDEWSAQEKSDYIADVTARHARARKLLYVLFPVVVVLMIDMIGLFVLDSLKNLFGA